MPSEVADARERIEGVRVRSKAYGLEEWIVQPTDDRTAKLESQTDSADDDVVTYRRLLDRHRHGAVYCPDGDADVLVDALNDLVGDGGGSDRDG